MTQMGADVLKSNSDNERDPETYAIIGAAMEVHRELGAGFLEAVYQEALAAELAGRGIEYAREVELPVTYKGIRLSGTYRADFICCGTIIVETKALRALGPSDEAQLLNYLKATGLQRAWRQSKSSESPHKNHLRSSASSADRTGSVS